MMTNYHNSYCECDKCKEWKSFIAVHQSQAVLLPDGTVTNPVADQALQDGVKAYRRIYSRD